jgi:hypothetical protein
LASLLLGAEQVLGVDTVELPELPDSRDALCAASSDILLLLHLQTHHFPPSSGLLKGLQQPC